MYSHLMIYSIASNAVQKGQKAKREEEEKEG